MASVRCKNGKFYIRYLDESGVVHDKATPALTKAEAKRIAAELEGNAWKSRAGLPVPIADNGMNLGDLLTWWLEKRSVGTASHSRNVSYVRAHLHNHPLAKLAVRLVTAAKIDEYLYDKAASVGPCTLNHLRGYLQAAFNAGRRAGLCHGDNPVLEVPRRRVPKRKPEYLRPQEVREVLAALSDKYRPLFACAIYAGLRKGELLGLHKRDIDWQALQIYVRRSHDRETTKGGCEGVVPIATELVPFLQAAAEAAPGQRLFPGDDGLAMRADAKLEVILRRAMARAGIVEGYRHVCRTKGCRHSALHPDETVRLCPQHGHKLWPKAQVRAIRFHDLRHTTASLLTMAGCNPAAVQRILRHTDPRITMEVYAHLAPGYLQSEVNRLTFFGGAQAAGELAGATISPDSPCVARLDTAQGAVEGLDLAANAERPGFPSDKSLKSGPNFESRGQDLNLRPSGYECPRLSFP